MTPSGMPTGPHHCLVAGLVGVIRSLPPQRPGVSSKTWRSWSRRSKSVPRWPIASRRWEQDQAVFTAAVRALVEPLDDTFDAGQVIAIGDELNSRLGEAIHDREVRSKGLKEIARVDEDIAEVENNLVELRAVAAEMFKAFGVDSLREVDNSLKKVAHRTTVRGELSDRKTKLMKSMKAKSLEEAVSALENTDSHELEREIAEIKGSTRGRIRPHERALFGARPRRGCY